MITHTLCPGRSPLITGTYGPLFGTLLLRGMPGLWQPRHRLVRCWLLGMPALFSGRKTLEERARWTPDAITAWRWRRVLTAAYWDVHLLVAWWGQAALQALPPPQAGALYRVGDGSHKPQRGPQNPLGQKGRKSAPQPWLFGSRFVLVIAHWDGYRLPGAFRLIRPQSQPAYPPENALWRELGGRFVPPAWAQWGIVEGDAA